MASASLGFGDFGMFNPAAIMGGFSDFSSSSAPSTSTTAVAPVATQIQEPSITTAIPTTTTASTTASTTGTTGTTATTQSVASSSSVSSYTIVRVLTAAETITRHSDLQESDVSITRHHTSDTEGIATVTLNANAAAPPSDDGFIATFTIESTRPLLMAIITNTHENADDDVVDACDHFFLVLGDRVAVGSAFETPVHIYAKVHDGDFLFSRLTDDSFSFNLVASSGG